MGVVASSVIKAGRSVTGIIPHALTQRERDGVISEEDYGETILVDDMHTRKSMMAQRASAFVSLPGGLGTLEEMFEVVRPRVKHVLTIGHLESAWYTR